MLERIICLVIGYAFGLLETGYFYGKLKNTDIRNHGSGNAGTTNALRVFGIKAGVITFVGDFVKAVIAVLLVYFIFKGEEPGYKALLGAYAGFGAVFGHNYPFYMKFKGGKGIATTAGLMFMVDPIGAAISITLFLIIAIASKYVSVASLIAVTMVTILNFVFGYMGMLKIDPAFMTEFYVLSGILMASAFYKHKANIKRLLNGTENKLNLKHKGPQDGME